MFAKYLKWRLLITGLTAIGITLGAELARAEGNCPPGYFPIGGQGVRGCSPIGSSGAAGGAGASGPSGRWLKTWGAVAVSKNGVGAATVGKKSKAEAQRSVVETCRADGGEGCRSVFTFRNQCYAITLGGPVAGNSIRSAETIELAETNAMAGCRNRGGEGCEVIGSACTEPIFIAY